MSTSRVSTHSKLKIALDRDINFAGLGCERAYHRGFDEALEDTGYNLAYTRRLHGASIVCLSEYL